MWPFRRKEKRSGLANPQQWLVDMFTGGTKSATGVNVTPDRALQAAAVYACVRVIAETIASLPLHVYKRLDRGKEKALDHYLYPILHDAPNPEMTSLEFREMMAGHLCLRGNAYAEKVFDRAGRVKELWPLNPDRVTVERDKATKRLVYTVSIPDEARQVKLNVDRILHIRGLSGDGIIGYSPIKLARETIGLYLAAEEYGARYFGNGSRPGGVLEHPGKLGIEARKNLKKSWEEMHQGLEQSHRVAILEEGIKWHQIGLSPEDSQLLQLLQASTTTIASIFRVQPHKIGDLTRSTNNNIEHQGIEFVVDTMTPWCVRFEQGFKQRLFDKDYDAEYFASFTLNGLLRGDHAGRSSYYTSMFNIGAMSQNDIRELEDMNPIKDGDKYFVPLNMVPADQTNKVGDMAKLKDMMQGEDKKQKQRFNNAFRHLFRDAITRIIKRERADVLRQVRKKTNAEEFGKWLDEFYKEHEEFVRRNITPVMTSFLELLGQSEAIEDSVNEYVEKHVRNSVENIQAIIRNESDREKSLVEMFDMWEGKRTAEMAIQETTLYA